MVAGSTRTTWPPGPSSDSPPTAAARRSARPAPALRVEAGTRRRGRGGPCRERRPRDAKRGEAALEQRRLAHAAPTLAAPRRDRRPELAEEPQCQAPGVEVGLAARRPRAGARRAARLAAAGGDELGGTCHELVVAVPEPLGHADAAGDRLVQVDRGRLRVRRTHLGDEAEVAGIDHQEHARDGLHRPSRAEQRDVELLAPPPAGQGVGRDPVGGGLQLDLGQVDGAPADVLVRAELELLVEGDEARDHHLAVHATAAGGGTGAEDVDRLEGDGPVGVRVVVGVDPVDVRLALAPFEPVDVVLDGLVHVDRVLVDEHLGREQVDLAEHARPVRRRVDDHHVLGRRGAQRDLRGREVLRAPVPAAVLALVHVPALGDERQQVVGRALPEDLARLEGHLERRRPQVGQQDVQVVGVDAGLLGRVLEEELRVVDHVLVHRRGRRDEDRDRDVLAPPGAPDLLPRGGDRAGIAGEDGDVEPADVDAELERVRAHDPEDLAAPQALLDGAPLGGQVAAAVAADPRPGPAVLPERLAQPREDQLDARARSSEDDRLPACPQERQRPALGERERRPAGARRPVDDGRVHEEDVARAGGRAVPVHDERRPAGEARRQLARGSRWSPSR